MSLSIFNGGSFARVKRVAIGWHGGATEAVPSSRHHRGGGGEG